MEEKRFVFSSAISDFIEEIKKEFEETRPEDPMKWFMDALKRHCMVKEEEAEKVAGEILEGIRYYRKIKGLVNPLEEFKDKITEEDIKALKDETELLKARISEEA
jgi:hypothetical protein